MFELLCALIVCHAEADYIVCHAEAGISYRSICDIIICMVGISYIIAADRPAHRPGIILVGRIIL